MRIASFNVESLFDRAKAFNEGESAVVEADNRIALRDFSKIMLTKIGDVPFDHVMLIDGNDDRGIDVGVMTRGDSAITQIRSHVDDTDAHGEVFSRDCLEVTVATPGA